MVIVVNINFEGQLEGSSDQNFSFCKNTAHTVIKTCKLTIKIVKHYPDFKIIHLKIMTSQNNLFSLIFGFIIYFLILIYKHINFSIVTLYIRINQNRNI